MASLISQLLKTSSQKKINYLMRFPVLNVSCHLSVGSNALNTPKLLTLKADANGNKNAELIQCCWFQSPETSSLCSLFTMVHPSVTASTHQEFKQHTSPIFCYLFPTPKDNFDKFWGDTRQLLCYINIYIWMLLRFKCLISNFCDDIKKSNRAVRICKLAIFPISSTFFSDIKIWR